ncbi:short-chain dehydrogenase/reductase, partial [Jimgerdemannia flammicorona]
MSPRVVLITGYSSVFPSPSSIGKQADKYKVHATMRNLGKDNDLKQAAAEHVRWSIRPREFLKPNLHVSISSTLSWRTAITSTVNNAGLGFPEALEQASLQEIREIFETNFFGPPLNDAYCAAKLPWRAMAVSLSHFNIKVSVVEPGPISTKFFDNVLAGVMQTADEVANIITNDIVENPKPHFRNSTSQYVRNIIAQKFTTPDGDNHICGVIEKAYNEDETGIG